jgi:hypothetical protein
MQAASSGKHLRHGRTARPTARIVMPNTGRRPACKLHLGIADLTLRTSRRLPVACSLCGLPRAKEIGLCGREPSAGSSRTTEVPIPGGPVRYRVGEFWPPTSRLPPASRGTTSGRIPAKTMDHDSPNPASPSDDSVSSSPRWRVMTVRAAEKAETWPVMVSRKDSFSSE